MTERLYYTDSYLRSFDAEVVARRPVDDGIEVVLSRSAFYPTSGGQPHDTGTLDGAEVVDVREEGDAVVHVVTRPVDGRVHGEIDWPRRFDHMQQHTGQHILSQAALQVLGARTRAVHFGAQTATCDLDRSALTHEEAAAVEDLANGIVFDDRPVHIRQVEDAELPTLGLRRPPKKAGLIRIVEVEGFDRSACGGTHVGRTGEVGCIAIRRWERHRGGVRLEFLCGWRALRDGRRKAALLADLAGALTVAADDLPDAVARLSAQLKASERAVVDLRDRLLAREAADHLAAADLLAGPPGTARLVAAALPRSAEDAAALAGALIGAGPCVAVLAAAEGRLIIARSPDVALDAAAVLRQTMERHGGRGGGRPEFAQGAVPADRAIAAMQTARAIVAGLFGAAGG